MSIGTTGMAILSIVINAIEHGGRGYCFLKRKTIQERLYKWKGIWVSIKTIDYHLGRFKRLGYFQCYQRYGRNLDGTVFYKTTNRYLTKACSAFLINLGIKFSVWLYKKIFHHKPKVPKVTQGKKLLKKKYIKIDGEYGQLPDYSWQPL